jgi:hypothetical protein
MSLSSFAAAVAQELHQARQGHKNTNSVHEGYAVILEELDEFKEEVWKKPKKRDRVAMLRELVQIAAMAQRTAEDVLMVSNELSMPGTFAAVLAHTKPQPTDHNDQWL